MAGTLTTLHYLEDPGVYLRPGVYWNVGLKTLAFIRDPTIIWDPAFNRSFMDMLSGGAAVQCVWF